MILLSFLVYNDTHLADIKSQLELKFLASNLQHAEGEQKEITTLSINTLNKITQDINEKDQNLISGTPSKGYILRQPLKSRLQSRMTCRFDRLSSESRLEYVIFRYNNRLYLIYKVTYTLYLYYNH